VIHADDPAKPAVDDKNDILQEDTLRPPFENIGRAFAKRI